MRKFTVYASALLSFFMVLGLMGNANADTVQGTVTVTNPSVVSHSSASVSVTGVAMATTSTKVQLQFRVATGFHPTHPTVHYIRTGTKYANSGTNRNGTTTWFTDTCGAGSLYTHPLTSGAHKGQCVFYWDAKLHSWRKPDCGNLVRFSNLPRLTFKSVILYKSFANIRWKDTLRLTETAKGSATASCTITVNGTTSSSSALAYADVKVSIVVTVYVYARFSFQAKASGAHVTITSSQQSALNVQILAAASLQIKVSVTASCSVTTSPPPPPPTATPPSVSVTMLNDVDAGSTSPNFCASAHQLGTDNGTVVFTSTYGSFSAPTAGGAITSGSAKWTSVGNDATVCATYVAPEVPSGGHDTIEVYLTDNVTGLSATTNSQTFPINTPPPPPA